MTSTKRDSTTKGGDKIVGCYKPLIRYTNLQEKKIKAKDGHLYLPGHIISNEKWLEQYDDFQLNSNYSYEFIPCGKCIGCRLEYSRRWANRGYLESLNNDHNYFITLTYNDEWLPIPEQMETKEGYTFTPIKEIEWKGTLLPSDLDRFINSIRKYFERKGHTNIRFMACGEYGSEFNTRRPHYHIILFNAPFPMKSFYNPRISWGKDIYWQNEIIEANWKYGISNMCEANWNNIAYVARYITKKINGKGSEEEYAALGQIKEFFKASTHPGIGYEYYKNNKEEIYKNDKILIRNKKGSHWVTPPKYFDDLLKKEDPAMYEEIKRARKRKAKNKQKIKDTLTSLSRYEQLQIEKSAHEQSSKALKRNNIQETKKEEQKQIRKVSMQRQKSIQDEITKL